MIAKKKPALKSKVAKKAVQTKTTIFPAARDIPFEEDGQEENENDISLSESDFAGLLVAPSDWTIDSISRQIGKQIDLNPDFQRRGVWNNKAKSKFIESLFLNVPIPQVLLASKQKDINQFIVLDGKQRPRRTLEPRAPLPASLPSW